MQIDISRTLAGTVHRMVTHEHNRLMRRPLRKGEHASSRAMQLADLARLATELRTKIDRFDAENS